MAAELLQEDDRMRFINKCELSGSCLGKIILCEDSDGSYVLLGKFIHDASFAQMTAMDLRGLPGIAEGRYGSRVGQHRNVEAVGTVVGGAWLLVIADNAYLLGSSQHYGEIDDSAVRLCLLDYLVVRIVE